MGITSSSAEYLATLASFEHAVERLAAMDPVMHSSQQVLDGLRRVETAARKVPYVQHVLTAAAVDRNLPRELGYTGIKELLTEQLRLAGSEARARMAGARNRVPGHSYGEPLEPALAAVAAGQRAGVISERHAAVIENTLRRCGRRLSPQEAGELEELMATAAQDVTPEDLTAIGRRAVELIDPDGHEPDPDTIRRARGLTLDPQDEDLLTGIDGTLTPHARALLDAVLAKYARPGVLNPDDADQPIDPDDRDAVAAAAKRDTRSTAQRNHDALVHALEIALGSGRLGSHRGVPCIPIITLTVDQLDTETGIATTATGGRLPVPDALAMMGTNPKYVLLLNLHGRPLYLGREQRLASLDQRIALYGSEKGCSAPGCDAPATRCQVHHVQEWQAGGRTDITTLTLACDAHHGKVVPMEPADPGTTEPGSRPPGFETVTLRGGPYAGRTGWRRTPDPGGAFRVNHSHHPDELHRQAKLRWQRQREEFRRAWQAQDLRRQYRDKTGTVDHDIAKILDGPHGPPILDRLLAEHDNDNAWRAPDEGARNAHTDIPGEYSGGRPSTTRAA